MLYKSLNLLPKRSFIIPYLCLSFRPALISILLYDLAKFILPPTSSKLVPKALSSVTPTLSPPIKGNQDGNLP